MNRQTEKRRQECTQTNRQADRYSRGIVISAPKRNISQNVEKQHNYKSVLTHKW